ncbi:hypothetical protein JTB14_019632 [Gonioctena quinquepunctata]|nr:hypothetical protein JTB14_019632 [Gonioctena quinquepunctata]
MEIVEEISSQYVSNVPIAFIFIVIVGAILVFTFGFQSAEQPPFDKLTSDDRKSTGKKRKIKEKKTTANGFLSEESISEKDLKKSPVKEISDIKQEKKDKKPDSKHFEKNKKNEISKAKSSEDIKNKRNVKKIPEKPFDFDEGDWERVPTKSDKKKKEISKTDKDKKKEKSKEEIFEVPLTQVEELPVKLVQPTQVAEIMEECKSKSNEKSAIFDELGDVWTETKAAKKTSKKKVRRDN